MVYERTLLVGRFWAIVPRQAFPALGTKASCRFSATCIGNVLVLLSLQVVVVGGLQWLVGGGGVGGGYWVVGGWRSGWCGWGKAKR